MDNLTWFAKILIMLTLDLAAAFIVMMVFPWIAVGTISYSVAFILAVAARIIPTFVGLR